MKKRNPKKKSGAGHISELYAEFTPKEREHIEKGAQILLMEYELLSALRKSRDLTQEEVAAIMEIGQSAISKIETQEDILVKTLERYIQALGGKLEVRAKFPDKVVTLNQFTRHVLGAEIHPQ
jgi:DNA-binding XRE family transcriptional regulator